jgi:crotonobetainyl-CoA:carnitine CoA-transferase CaiB-like acyl-CoA transferase
MRRLIRGGRNRSGVMTVAEERWSEEEYREYASRLFDPALVWDKPEMLAGVRVLEVGTIIFGPLITCILAELGAEVIKVELPPGAREQLPDGGDLMRYFGLADEGSIKGTSLQSFYANRNKKCITLDVHCPEGREIFQRLAAQPETDIVVENLRAGAMDFMGIGYRQLSQENPRLIYLAANGPGQWGPNADMVSYDLVGQACSGFAYLTGFPSDAPQHAGIPTKSGFYLADSVGAVWGAMAVLGALYYRQSSGKGQFIELSQFSGLMRLMEIALEWYSTTGNVRERKGNWDAVIAPYCITQCKDGYVALAAVGDKIFQNLCDAMERPELKDDPRFRDNESRVHHERDLYAIIDEWLMQHTNAELRELADQHSFAFAPVMSARDICHFPHFLERGEVQEFTDPHYGKMKIATLPPHFSETPARVRTLCKPVGADNEAVYTEYLGLSPEELARLRQEKII